MNQQQRNRLAETWLSEIKFDVSMSEYSTLRVGGRAAALIDVHTLKELQKLLVQLDEEQIKFLIIGRGSNILIADSGYPGVVVRLKGEFKTIALLNSSESAQEDIVVRAGAGAALSNLVSWCSGQGLTGVEFMVGIPGSVGGAVRMNAGAWGHEIGERLREIEVIDHRGGIQQIPVEELQLSYRKLALKNGVIDSMVVTSATFNLAPGQEEQIRSRCIQNLKRRQGKQPVGVASAGSFFKNPHGDSAGRLIEAAGLKGVCCGQAMVSPVHANFIVNTGQATATDIILLMERIQTAVFQQFAIKLEPEVRIFQESCSVDFS